MKIGFIGAGEMGGAIIRGLLSKGYPKEDILAGVHTAESAARLQAELGITAGTDNVRVIREANWLFLAVKPAQVAAVLQQIAACGTPAKPLISMALGWSVEKSNRCCRRGLLSALCPIRRWRWGKGSRCSTLPKKPPSGPAGK